MKKLILLTVILSNVFYTYGQAVFVHTDKNVELLKKEPIKVVITDNKIGKILKKVVTENWVATKYEFITSEELSSYSDKQQVTLLGNFRGTFQAHKWELKNAPFLGIINSYRKEKSYDRTKEITVYLVYDFESLPEENLESMMLLNITTLQYLISTGGYSKWYPSMTEKIKTKSVKRKTVLICDEDLKAPLADLKKKYTGKVEVVDRATYNKAILNKEDYVFFLNMRSSLYHSLILIDNKGFVYYSDINSSSAQMGWDKEYQLRFFKYLD